MRKMSKKILAFILIAATIILGNTFANAAIQLPEKVRVGLYYGSTAVANFNISAEKGLQVGFLKNGMFIVLYEEPSAAAVEIRKDAYYIKTDNVYKEYNPMDKTVTGSERIGPYHIQIGGSFNDLNSVRQQIEIIKQKGILAYPVYTDTWRIWTGFYIDMDTAQADIVNNVQKKLGNGTYNVITPAPNMITITSGSGDIAAMFGSDTDRLQVRPKAENNPCILKINNSRSYRGEIEVWRRDGGNLTIINILPFEQYLYGVVPAEIEAYSHPEALKAQAVVARTYTLNSIGKHANEGFDLCASQHCQIYKGFNEETAATNKAVDDTKGKMVLYNGSPAKVFYFASSGGRTEDVKNVWGSEYPYLKSVEDKYESGKSYRYNWDISLTADQVKQMVLLRGSDIGDILGIKITKLSEAGRPTEIVINGTKGQSVYKNESTRTVFNLYSQWYTISTDADVSMRDSAGTDVKTQLASRKVITADGIKELPVKSNTTILGSDGRKTVVKTNPGVYKFTGKGWGHAVGMSQEGAKGMASAGYDYKYILKWYFPGTEVQ